MISEADWEQGAEHFNAGRYWLAHECWEQSWTTLSRPLRDHVQALIQLCGILHLVQRGRVEPSLRLCARARALLAAAESAGGVSGIVPRIEVPGVSLVLGRVQKALEKNVPPDEVLALASALRARVLRG